MSYCRFNFEKDEECDLSDIYCYLNVDGHYYVHVATHRVFLEDPHNICKDTIKYVGTGLGYDGENYRFESAKETLECLTMLKETGYNVPEYALNRLKEEVSE